MWLKSVRARLWWDIWFSCTKLVRGISCHQACGAESIVKIGAQLAVCWWRYRFLLCIVVVTFTLANERTSTVCMFRSFNPKCTCYVSHWNNIFIASHIVSLLCIPVMFLGKFRLKFGLSQCRAKVFFLFVVGILSSIGNPLNHVTKCRRTLDWNYRRFLAKFWCSILFITCFFNDWMYGYHYSFLLHNFRWRCFLLLHRFLHFPEWWHLSISLLFLFFHRFGYLLSDLFACWSWELRVIDVLDWVDSADDVDIEGVFLSTDWSVICLFRT